ncbi:MAG: TolC family protein [Archangium sp.]
MRSLIFAVVAVASVASATETLTVEDAVKRAIELNLQMEAARERREAAADGARSVRGQMLPALGVSDELQHYDGPFQVSFGPQMLTVRDQNVNTLALSARQPVVGLLKLSQDFVAANANTEAADAVVVATERAAREAVETNYLRLYEARAAREVAQASQKQLAEQLVVSKARVEAGAMTNADVLRVEVARANIQQQELQAGVQESAARASLLTMLGFPLDADVDFAAPLTLEAEADKPVPSVADATSTALSTRSDLQQQVRLLDAAEATSRSRLAALLPDIDLTAAYVRVDGQTLAQQNAAYIGVRASWAFWLWGTQWYAHRSAEHQAQAARLLTNDLTLQVRSDVSVRMDQLRAATSAIDVAKTALSSAEEAYRVTAAVVQAGSGTTTDLLDSQSALTQAKLNLVRSRYQQALARVQLRRAMGG